VPELPEVESIRQGLRLGVSGDERAGERPSLIGMEISAVDVLWARSIHTPDAAEFVATLPGRALVEVGRRGKFLIFHLSAGAMLIHLRMSGDLLVERGGDYGAHQRVVIHFKQGWRLAFNDPRKFGRVWLVDDPEQVLAGLGPEPLAPSFSSQLLAEKLQATTRQIKPLLMDQSFLAGLGNIYTDEALYRAKIHPLTPARQVSRERAEALWDSIRFVLAEGIRMNGASIDWVYRGGAFQNQFQVYGRKGQACRACGTTIQRILVGQRSTFFCPICQSLTENRPV